MFKKIRIWRVLLVVAVVVMANLYFGCVHKYPASSDGGYQRQQDTKIGHQDAEIAELKKEIEEMKNNQ